MKFSDRWVAIYSANWMNEWMDGWNWNERKTRLSNSLKTKWISKKKKQHKIPKLVMVHEFIYICKGKESSSSSSTTPFLPFSMNLNWRVLKMLLFFKHLISTRISRAWTRSKDNTTHFDCYCSFVFDFLNRHIIVLCFNSSSVNFGLQIRHGTSWFYFRTEEKGMKDVMEFELIGTT